jgi:diguanylate cyclase (GGDEF)-like protein
MGCDCWIGGRVWQLRLRRRRPCHPRYGPAPFPFPSCLLECACLARSLCVLCLRHFRDSTSVRTRTKRSQLDPLTGIPNRRSFFERLEIEKSRAKRYDHPLTLAYIDLDNFKQVNDRFGHSTGDNLLSLVAHVIREGLRSTDSVARLGGDEFAVLLSETNSAAATSAADKLRSSLNAAMKQHNWSVTFSIGVVTFQPPPESVQEMITAADRAMYAEKKAGRGRVTVEPPAA